MTDTLASALVAAQADMPAVEKNAVNPHFGSRFVSLDHLIAKTKPVLTKHGLAIVQLPSDVDGAPGLRTVLLHSSGEQIEATVPLVLGKQDMQGLGGALTYARRYGWASVLGICDETDDDGNQASAASVGAHTAERGGGDGSTPSESPAASTNSGDWTWPFGKHKGARLADTPAAYLDWFLNNSDKEDIKERIREFLNLEELAAVGGGSFMQDDDIPWDN